MNALTRFLGCSVRPLDALRSWCLLLLFLCLCAPGSAIASDGVLVFAPDRVEWVSVLAAHLQAVGRPVVVETAPSATLLDAKWTQSLERLDAAVRAHDPQWVIVAWGDGEASNLLDDQGATVAWGEPRWDAVYRERVAALASAARGRRGLWVGPRTHPHPNTNLRQAAIGLWISDTLRSFGEWRFADAFSATSDPYGHYALRADGPLPTETASPALRVRATGRLTPAGADVFAGWLLTEMERAAPRSDAGP